MTLFEAAKKPLIGDLTLWESHIITIIFSSIMATLFALFAFESIRAIEYKHAEEKFKVDQQKLSSLIELSPLGMLRNSMDGYFTEANQAFLDIVGYTLEELNNLSYWDLTPSRYTSQEEIQLHLLNTIGKYGPYEKEYIHQDGHLIPVRMSGVLITGIDRSISIWSIIEDITETKRHEESTKIAAMVYEHTSEAIMVTDADGMINSVNPAFTSISGYSKEEVIGKNATNVKNSPYENLNNVAMMDALENTGYWQGEIINQGKNNESDVAWVTINTIYNADHSIHHRVAIFNDISEQKKSEALILQQANFDTLTGLPNRRLFYDRLEQEIKRAQRSSTTLALVFIDLDDFKKINDTLGHDVGDVLLKEAALRLEKSVRASDTVARFGGDEFTILLPDLTHTDRLDRILRTFLDKLSQPFKLGSEIVYISASMGISFFPDDGTNASVMLRNSDQAMYVAKRSGRNRYSYFTAAMQEQAQLQLRMINDLHAAFNNQEFFMVYQPIINLETGEVKKAEALIRWQHPIKGLISPSVFIPIAEDIGLINEIGEWVFKQAAQQVKRLAAMNIPDFQISVNKSPKQFADDKTFHSPWFDHLKSIGLTGNNICVEITEGLLLEASEDIHSTLLAFRDAGIEVSLDDFGTGYSSLSYLKKFSIDYIKIDQSFIQNLAADTDDLALCEAIIVMAHKLNIQVIAEGVETKEQLALLKDAGCDYVQGYYLSKPLIGIDFENFLLDPEQKIIGQTPIKRDLV